MHVGTAAERLQALRRTIVISWQRSENCRVVFPEAVSISSESGSGEPGLG